MIVAAARAGDADAWRRLVARFDGPLRHIARSYRLAPEDVDDAVQATWLELVESIERIRDPAAVGGWLATVTRRNALRTRRRHARELPKEDLCLGESSQSERPHEQAVAAERRVALAAAVSRLPAGHRRLVTVLVTQPALDYRQLGEQLSMPIGSIGPIRARALARLASDARLRAVAA